MNSELFDALEQLEKTKGIPVDYMIEKIEAALQAAFRKEYGSVSLRVDINRAKKELRVFKCLKIVEVVEDPKTEVSLETARAKSGRYEVGMTLEEEIKTKNFGRLSATAAKQVIVQGIREAEKNNIAREYEKKKEDVMQAIVTKVDDRTGDAWVDTDKSQNLLLPRSEQIPTETLTIGKRIQVFVSEIKNRGADEDISISISRTAPNMIKRLLEANVPEIADGTVIVKNVAREPGSRSKVSVYSRSEDVEAVGACIGEHGMRINNICEELNGEKIDVIPYCEKTEDYIAASLAPATVLSVDFDGERSATVQVAGDQLSLAIGKEGQNVRLAAKLTNCKIDIKGIKS